METIMEELKHWSDSNLSMIDQMSEDDLKEVYQAIAPLLDAISVKLKIDIKTIDNVTKLNAISNYLKSGGTPSPISERKASRLIDTF